MGKTGVVELTNSVKAKYMAEYLLAAAGRSVWSQFVDWDTIIEGQGGSSFKYVAYETMDSDDLGAKLPEKDDIEATSLKDSEITVTPYEYGRRVTLTHKVRFQSHVKTRQAAAKLVGQNMMDTVERAIRRGVLGGTNVFMPNNNVLRTELVVSDTASDNDRPTFEFLSQLASMAQSMGIEPIGQDFVAVIHPAVEPDILGLTEIKNIGYNFPEPLYKGEVARLCGIRFVKSRYGRLYLGGGKVTGVATTLAAAESAGDTSINLTSITTPAIVAGDWITIGTLDPTTGDTADLEQVQVTSIAGGATAVAIRGAGNGANNFGLKYDHPLGAVVNEATNAAAICLLGANSVKGVYGSDTGKFGKSVIKENIDSLNRLLSLGWFWYGGLGIVPKYVLRGEVACKQNIFGGN